MYLMDVCCQKAVCVDRGEPVVRAAQAMRAHDVGELVVTREVGRRAVPVGIVTDREIVLRAVAEEAMDLSTLAVGDLLPPDPMILGAFTHIDEAVRRMGAELVRRAPVVDTDGRLVGYVTLEGLLDAMLTSSRRGHWNQREWTTLMEY